MFEHYYQRALKIRAGDRLDLDFKRIFVYLNGWEETCQDDVLFTYPAQTVGDSFFDTDCQSIEDPYSIDPTGPQRICLLYYATLTNDKAYAFLGDDMMDADKTFVLTKGLKKDFTLEPGGETESRTIGFIGVQLEQDFIKNFAKAAESESKYRHRLYTFNNDLLNEDDINFNFNDTILDGDYVSFNESFRIGETDKPHFCFKQNMELSGLTDAGLNVDYFTDEIYKGIFCVEKSDIILESEERHETFIGYQTTSRYIVYFLLIISIPLQLIGINRYANDISKPIKDLTNFTKKYREQQSNKAREEVKADIKDDKLFVKIKEQFEIEQKLEEIL